jgi:hypothetical protein
MQRRKAHRKYRTRSPAQGERRDKSQPYATEVEDYSGAGVIDRPSEDSGKRQRLNPPEEK